MGPTAGPSESVGPGGHVAPQHVGSWPPAARAVRAASSTATSPPSIWLSGEGAELHGCQVPGCFEELQAGYNEVRACKHGGAGCAELPVQPA